MHTTSCHESHSFALTRSSASQDGKADPEKATSAPESSAPAEANQSEMV